METHKVAMVRIGKMLEGKTIGEVEQELGITEYDYTGVGFGYQLKEHYPKNRAEALKDIEKPEFDELVRIADGL